MPQPPRSSGSDHSRSHMGPWGRTWGRLGERSLRNTDANRITVNILGHRERDMTWHHYLIMINFLSINLCWCDIWQSHFVFFCPVHFFLHFFMFLDMKQVGTLPSLPHVAPPVSGPVLWCDPMYLWTVTVLHEDRKSAGREENFSIRKEYEHFSDQLLLHPSSEVKVHLHRATLISASTLSPVQWFLTWESTKAVRGR